jgi:hypothetical protein
VGKGLEKAPDADKVISTPTHRNGRPVNLITDGRWTNAGEARE